MSFFEEPWPLLWAKLDPPKIHTLKFLCLVPWTFILFGNTVFADIPSQARMKSDWSRAGT